MADKTFLFVEKNSCLVFFRLLLPALQMCCGTHNCFQIVVFLKVPLPTKTIVV